MIGFFVLLIVLTLVLTSVTFLNFSGITSRTIENSDDLGLDEWKGTIDASIGKYEIGEGKFRAYYTLESFDNLDRKVDVDVVLKFDGNILGESEDRVFLGAGREGEYVINTDLEGNVPVGSVLKMTFSDGNLIRERSKVIGSSVGISAFAVRDDIKESKFTSYGIIFLISIGLIFLAEIIYKNYKRRKERVSSRLGKKFKRKTIDIDVR